MALATQKGRGCKILLLLLYGFDSDVNCTDRRSAPPHMRLCMTPRYLRVLSQLRVGWARLEVVTGRWHKPPVPRAQRVCRVCMGEDSRLAWRREALTRCCPGWHADGSATPPVVDLRHFVLECPAYDDIRSNYGVLPARPWQSSDPDAVLRAVFAHEDQMALARMLHAMMECRAQVLGLVAWW
jgi:hypothetical protein